MGVWKHASVTNFIILGLRLGNRVRVRVSIRLSVSGPMCPTSELSVLLLVMCCSKPCQTLSSLCEFFRGRPNAEFPGKFSSSMGLGKHCGRQ